MNSSKFQLIFTGVFAAFILIGVGFFAFGSNGNSAGISHIVIWGTYPEQKFTDIYGKSAFSKSKTIAVQYKEKSEANFDSEFVNALAEGTGPDAIFIDSDDLLTYKSKLLVIPYKSYPERTYKDTFVEGSELFLFPEGVYALPLAVDPIVMYWNRDIFTNASLSRPPEYWDEFYNLSQSLSTKDGAFNVTRSTVALGEYQNITNAGAILSALILQAGNPIVNLVNGFPTSVLNDKMDLAIPPAQAALTFYTEFSNPAKSYYSWNRSLPQSQTAFLAGDLAIYFGFASEYPLLRIKNPNLNFDMSVLPQSSNVKNGARKVTFAKIKGLAIVKNSKNIGAAFSALQEFTNQDMAKSLSESINMAPARKDLLAVKQTDSVKPVLYDSTLWSKGWLDPDKSGTNAAFREMVESVTGGRTRIEGAINQASLQIGNLIK